METYKRFSKPSGVRIREAFSPELDTALEPDFVFKRSSRCICRVCGVAVCPDEVFKYPLAFCTAAGSDKSLCSDQDHFLYPHERPVFVIVCPSDCVHSELYISVWYERQFYILDFHSGDRLSCNPVPCNSFQQWGLKFFVDPPALAHVCVWNLVVQKVVDA